MSQQSWVQLDSPFTLPNEANGLVKKRNSPSLFEEHIPSLWSKNVHPKILFSEEKGSVLDKLEMFEEQMFPFVHLHWKLLNALQNFESSGKTSQIFKKKILLMWKKRIISISFSIENQSIFWRFFLLYQPDETNKQGVENTSDWFF